MSKHGAGDYVRGCGPAGLDGGVYGAQAVGLLEFVDYGVAHFAEGVETFFVGAD